MIRKSLLMLCLFLPLSAHAIVVEWELVDFQFDDGGTASGTFIFDTESDEFLAIDINTTLGTNVAGRHYAYTAGAWGSLADRGILAFSDVSGPTNYVGAGWFRIDADIAYEAQQGDIVNQWLAVGAESFCTNVGCSSAANEITNPGETRETVSGYLVSKSVVPVPAAVWLFGSALAFLGWIRRKQTV
jgi:hypothetical protein